MTCWVPSGVLWSWFAGVWTCLVISVSPDVVGVLAGPVWVSLPPRWFSSSSCGGPVPLRGVCGALCERSLGPSWRGSPTGKDCPSRVPGSPCRTLLPDGWKEICVGLLAVSSGWYLAVPTTEPGQGSITRPQQMDSAFQKRYWATARHVAWNNSPQLQPLGTACPGLNRPPFFIWYLWVRFLLLGFWGFPVLSENSQYIWAPPPLKLRTSCGGAQPFTISKCVSRITLYVSP